MKDRYTLTDTIYTCLKSLPDSHMCRDIIILESQHPDHPESTQTYVAAFSDNYLEANGSNIEWKRGSNTRLFKSDPWQSLEEFRKSANWAFGYIGYDTGRSDLNNSTVDEARYAAPDLYFMEPAYLFRIDGEGVHQVLGDTVELKKHFQQSGFQITGMSKGIRKSGYIEAIKTIKHLIAEGDFYELNFSYPITANFTGNAYDLYRKMREVNPVPFASFVELETHNLSVCCSSPERFLKKTGSRIISEPIKGTSARGVNENEDARFRDELKSEKNEAENLMIVDLVRHDLSGVCKPGSIEVTKLFEIQTFGTVHQLISRVEGTVIDNIAPVEIIRACFPMGSMTGAPKIRVMQRIEELENYQRGIYSGAIGYFKPDGDFDFNVVIRSAIVSGGELVYPVGGAITGDSDPEEEWSETAIKSRVLKLVQNRYE